MWQFLDFVSRLILLGGYALVGWFVWRIVSAGDTAQRVCVCCGVSLFPLELASCSDCLTVSACDNCGKFAVIDPELDPHTGEYCADCLAVSNA
jgi:hypothetical protein